MFFTMGVTLYTSRVVLNSLGIQDYGIYVIVGGVVSLFSFFNSAMSSATQRFLAFEIGRKDDIVLKQTFNATLNIHLGIGVLILVLAETVGLWFVNYKLNVPLEKMNAINWVYQFSILTFLVGVVQVPYNALIIARERMNIYAVFSIVEVSLKLLILYLLVVSPFEKLITYAVLIFCVTILIASFYKFYCKRNFTESKYQFYYEKQLYSTLVSYSGWNLFGNLAAVAKGQGINILLNLFFGTILNAAYGITMQVQGAVSVFVTNFQMAVNPQIIKNYAVGNTKQSLNLIFQSAKFSYFLMFLIACPVIFNIDFILKIWLKNPPEYTSIFVVLSLINILIDSISGPLMTGAQATGNIKWYQIVIGTLIFLNLPISYFLLILYKLPYLIFYVSIAISIISLVFRFIFLNKLVQLPILDFLKNVLLKISIVTLMLILLNQFIIQKIIIENNWVNFILNISLVTFFSLLLIYFVGINNEEKKLLKSLIIRK